MLTIACQATAGFAEVMRFQMLTIACQATAGFAEVMHVQMLTIACQATAGFAEVMHVHMLTIACQATAGFAEVMHVQTLTIACQATAGFAEVMHVQTLTIAGQSCPVEPAFSHAALLVGGGRPRTHSPRALLAGCSQLLRHKRLERVAELPPPAWVDLIPVVLESSGRRPSSRHASWQTRSRHR